MNKVTKDIYYVGVNDHQVDFCKEVEVRMGTIITIMEINRLGRVIEQYQQVQRKIDNSSNNVKFNNDLEKIVNEIF